MMKNPHDADHLADWLAEREIEAEDARQDAYWSREAARWPAGDSDPWATGDPVPAF